MKKKESWINQIESGRLWKTLGTRVRWGIRRWRRSLQKKQFKERLFGSFARRLYAMLLLLVAVGGITYAAAWYGERWSADEAVLKERLSMGAYDAEDPVLTALDSFGASNRVQVILKTIKKDPLKPQSVDLDRGNLNLVMTLQNGKIMEYTLQNKRIDNFESGSTDYFTLILPETISPFDIKEYKLMLLPDAKGDYDEWHCASAQIACLLGGERTLLAKGSWQKECVLSADRTEAVLPLATEGNAHFQQVQALYSYALQVCEKQGAVHTKQMKQKANVALGLMSGDTLHLDIETVGLENQNQLFKDSLNHPFSEFETLGYNGTMTLRVKFLYAFDGSYYKDYNLDTLGKDDFELGTASTFALEMPEGASVFDITAMELLVNDTEDAWAPRLIRAYLRTDYGTTLELARLSDTMLAAERKTNIFHRDWINTSISPLKLDLERSYALPVAIKESIEKQYYTEIEGVIYSMYFGDHNFIERQKLYYSQIYKGVADEET